MGVIVLYTWCEPEHTKTTRCFMTTADVKLLSTVKSWVCPVNLTLLPSQPEATKSQRFNLETSVSMMS